MKTDSEEFKKLVEEARGRDKRLDELRIVVIKWHLLVEQALDIMLTSAVFESGRVGNRRNEIPPERAVSGSTQLKRRQGPDMERILGVKPIEKQDRA